MTERNTYASNKPEKTIKLNIMKVSKLKLRHLILIITCVVVSAVFSGCSKEETADSIVGKWVTSDYNSNHNDTIHFTSTMRVEDYFLFAHTAKYPADSYYFTYSLSGNTIKITSHQPESTEYTETYEYAINGNSLKIKGFSNPFSATLEARFDVNFTKVK